MITTKPYEKVLYLFQHAICNGGDRISLSTVKWDVSGNCQQPVNRVLRGVPCKINGLHITDRSIGKRSTLFVDMDLRCRKCQNCLRMRAKHWAHRANTEIVQSQRTWFGTMTLTPQNQQRFLDISRKRFIDQGLDFELLPIGEQLTERHKSINPEITKWLKRIRKNYAVSFRYMIVLEPHSSGAPHYHMLLHEHQDTILKKYLDTWPLGFSNFKLVREQGVAPYITKYLTKSSKARVRASLRYGLQENNTF